MGKFRKKPVVIEAVLIFDILSSPENDWSGIPEWVRTAYEESVITFEPGKLSVVTLEGTMTGGIDDWLIKGVNGELPLQGRDLHRDLRCCD